MRYSIDGLTSPFLAHFQKGAFSVTGKNDAKRTTSRSNSFGLETANGDAKSTLVQGLESASSEMDVAAINGLSPSRPLQPADADQDVNEAACFAPFWYPLGHEVSSELLQNQDVSLSEIPVMCTTCVGLESAPPSPSLQDAPCNLDFSAGAFEDAPEPAVDTPVTVVTSEGDREETRLSREAAESLPVDTDVDCPMDQSEQPSMTSEDSHTTICEAATTPPRTLEEPMDNPEAVLPTPADTPEAVLPASAEALIDFIIASGQKRPPTHEMSTATSSSSSASNDLGIDGEEMPCLGPAPEAHVILPAGELAMTPIAVSVGAASADVGPTMTSEVLLHIYDVSNQACVQWLNSVLANRLSPIKFGGIFHVGVQINGKEWFFGHANRGTGVTWTVPLTLEEHHFRETIHLPHTKLPEHEVNAIIASLQNEYMGRGYHLFRRNCCHFADDFCQRLGVGRIPAWTYRLANIGDSAVQTLQGGEGQVGLLHLSRSVAGALPQSLTGRALTAPPGSNNAPTPAPMLVAPPSPGAAAALAQSADTTGLDKNSFPL